MTTIVRIASIALLSLCIPLTAMAGAITLKTSDGIVLSGDHYGSGTKGVVLIHPNGSDRAIWSNLMGALRQQKVQAIAVDLRGHGKSRGDADALKGVEDVAAAVAYLRKRGATDITLLGANLGGNIALAAAAKDPEISSVVMLSPALNANGVKVSTALEPFNRRPLLLLAGADDTSASKAASMIADRVDSARVEIAPNGGTGVKMLNRADELEGILISWINGSYAAQQGESGVAVDGEVSDMETTGVKLGEK